MKSPPRYRRRFFSPSSHSRTFWDSHILSLSLARGWWRRKKSWKLKTQILCRIDVNWARIWLLNAREALGRELQHFNTHLNLFEMCFLGIFQLMAHGLTNGLAEWWKFFRSNFFTVKKFAQVEVYCVPRGSSPRENSPTSNSTAEWLAILKLNLNTSINISSEINWTSDRTSSATASASAAIFGASETHRVELESHGFERHFGIGAWIQFHKQWVRDSNNQSIQLR